MATHTLPKMKERVTTGTPATSPRDRRRCIHPTPPPTIQIEDQNQDRCVPLALHNLDPSGAKIYVEGISNRHGVNERNTAMMPPGVTCPATPSKTKRPSATINRPSLPHYNQLPIIWIFIASLLIQTYACLALGPLDPLIRQQNDYSVQVTELTPKNNLAPR